MNQSCNSTRQLLSEQRDRPLTPTEQATLRAHLADCAGCRAFDRDLQTGMAGIARLPRVSGSSAVREAVLAGVHPGGRSSWPRGWRGWTGQLLKIGGAVTAFALVAVILMTVFDGSGTSEPDNHLGGTGSQPGAIGQQTATPEPIATVPANADIYAPPICHPDQVAFSIVADAIPGDPDRNSPSFVRITLDALKSTGGVECRLAGPVTLWVSGPDALPNGIQGNPVTTSFDAMLGAGPATIEFNWSNWCGEPGPFIITAETTFASGANVGAHQGIEFSPPCEDASRSSELGRTTEAVTTPTDANCRGAATMTTTIDSITGGVQIWYVVDMSTGCGNDEGGAFRLEEPTGGLLEIEGNNSEVTFTASEAGAFEWVGMLWTNWCDDIDQVKMELGNETWGFGSWVEERPTCQDAGQPSRLTVLDIPPADPWPAGVDPAPITPMPGITGEPPVCDPETLQLLLLPMPSPGLPIVIGASADGNAEAEFCSLDASELILTITDANGQPIAVEGNGVTFTLGTDEPLLLHNTGSEGVIWENWCGEPGPFTITATIAGQTLTLELADGPECTDENLSSIIWGGNHERDPRRP